MSRKATDQIVHSRNAIAEAQVNSADFRFTPQRREVLDVLHEQRDHPTATEVFIRVKERIPGISLATVYNCLETLTQHGLVRQVNLDRAPSRYCPNLEDHGHFHCEVCGEISDVNLRPSTGPETLLQLPRGSTVTKLEIALRGECPKCAMARRSARRAAKN